MNKSFLNLVALVLSLLVLGTSTHALAAAPAASTAAATSITTSSAVLNGLGTPNGEATTGWFRYSATNPGSCNDTFGTRVPASGGTDLGSGAVAVPYGITTTGLTSGVTYFYCSIVSNGSGTALGTILSFTIPGPPVTVSTTASGITATTATLEGSANPVAASTTGWFRYATSDPGTCNDTFGTRAPTSGGSTLGMGTTSVDYTRAITGLVPGTTYYYCAIASNVYGTTFGAVLSFSALPATPTVTTNSPSVLTGTTATWSGSANPGGAATTGYFRYSTVSPGSCNDTFGTRAPSSGGSALGAGNTSVAFTQAVTGLTPATTYYVCALAVNSAGTGLGALLTVVTPSAPTAVTVSSTAITSTSATLNGSGIPNRATTTGYFRYATTNPGTCNDTFGSRAPVSGGSSLGAGTTSASYNQSIGGLSPATTYYYCAITNNAEGTAFGSVLSFVTLAAPTITTAAATLLTSSGATLNGSGNPNGAATTGWFRYATTNPGACNDTFGTRAPTSGSTSLGTGTVDVAFSRAITGLSPSTTYFFCAIGTNSFGTDFGAVLSFTTPAALPIVSTNSATLLTGTTAQLNGAANPGGDSTTAWFRYATASPGTCNDTFGTRAPTSGGSALGAGNTSVAFSQGITGLTPATTYYVCAIAQNSVGLAVGSVVSFVTPSAPTVVTIAATGVTSTAATLNGSGDPNGAATTGYFRYSATNPGTCNDTFGSRAPATGGTSLGSGTASVAFAQSISGLSAGTTYYFCAIASSTEGLAFGSVLTLNTLAAPVTTTLAATLVTTSGATLNGSANPNGSTSTGWFRFATTSPGTCNDTFGTRAPTSGSSALGTGTTDVAFNRGITGLVPNTTYYFCAIASNSFGTSFGAVLSFTTPPAGPVVTTNGTTLLTGTTGQLNGSANPGGDATTGWFRYSTTSPGTCNDTFGTRAPTSGGTSLGSGTSSVAFSQSITGLTPGTTYYVCALASNVVGTSFGTVVSFVTPSAPTVVTSAASALAATTATLNGSGNPNRATATGYFRYSTTNPGSCNDTFGSRAPVSGGSALGAGSTSVAFAQSISGLSAGTTYYFCAIASSSEGIALGSVLSFTTLASPIVTTAAATALTTTSATLNGSANPNGSTSTGYYRYATTDPGACNDTFGTRAPTSGGSALGTGTTDVPFTRAIAGLTPNTTYYFCAIASNAFGFGFGAVLSFTTPAALPAVTTSSATVLTGTTGQLNGSAIPGGDATTGWFRFSTASPGTCNDSFGTRAPIAGGSALGSGNSSVAFSQAIVGLTPGTTYYFCAIGQNSVGLAFGSVVTFVTPSAPTAVTTAATAIAANTATLNGTGNPNRASTTGYFRFATTNPGTCNDTFGSRAPVSGGSSLGAGSTSVAFAQAISGLSAGSTYYFCAITSSSEGMAFGSVLSFTTLSAPAVTTAAATALTSSSATLNGSANPNGSTSTGYYRYATTNPGTCSDSFGTRAPTTGGTALGTGTTDVVFPRPITGLVPSTTYYFCAIASNSFGTAFGAVLSFTTTAALPTVVTSSATLLTGTTGQLNGSANPGGDATSGWFRYATVSPGTCNDSFGTRAPVSGGSALGAGTSSVAFSQSITGLSPGTTYYFCAIAQNSVGTALGSVLSFITPAAPTVLTSAATAITSSTATLNGSGNPNRAATTGYFRYSTTNPVTCNDTFGSRAPVTGGSSLGSGSTSTAFAQSVSVLSPGTTYYYCAIASSSEGMAFGSVLSFTTIAAPSVTTLAATVVTSGSATLNGSANPNGATATGWFRYSTANPGTCSDAFGTRAPASGGTGLGTGTSAVSFSQAIAGLTPGVIYYYCAISSNSAGTSFGTLVSFTTAPALPTVTTNAPSGITTTGATLNGAANPNGDATSGWFRIDTVSPGTCNDTFGTRVPTSSGSPLGGGNTSVAYTQTATLLPGTTYYVCAIAQNAVGVALGNLRSFVTPALPEVATFAATPITATTATLNGSADPNGNTATGWFRYSTTSPGTCNDTFGTRAPASGGTSLGAGTAPVSYGQAIAGLTPATTYYFCALAMSSIGTSLGEILSFTTPSTQPVVTTLAATSVGLDGGILNGNANPNGLSTSAWFRYSTTNPGTCNDTFGTRTPSSGGTALGAGTTTSPFAATLSGLPTGVTYYYCAIAQNALGTSLGSVLSFTTTAAPSVATTLASSVTATGATLEGSANPNAVASTGWFRYSATSPGSCNDTFGTRAPTSGATALGAGSASVPYTRAITGLTAGTTYYFCAIASSASGTGFGAVLSFTTPAAPTVTTELVSTVTSTSASFEGTGNPNLAAATGYFRYATTSPGTCNDTFGTRAPSSGGTALGAGSSPVAFTQAVTTLSPSTTYFYCAIASNAVGTRFGALLSFTTPAAPTVVTLAASAVSSTSASLNGTADPNLSNTTGWFRYATTSPGTCNDTFGTRAPTSGGAALGAGTAAVPFGETLSVAPGTTYYFCAIAQNVAGTSFGSVLSFTTPAAPSVTTLAASSVGATSASLNGSAIPNLSAATGWFRYAATSPGTCNDTFGTRAPLSSGTSLGAGLSAVSFAQSLTGLSPGTTYYFCAIADNAVATGFGAVLSFTTPSAPAVTTLAASGVGSTNATLNGSGNPNLSASTAYFRYATTDPGTCSDAFGIRAPVSGGTALGAGSSAVPFGQALTSLVPGTTYYYCALASNVVGTGLGTVLSFTTPAAPTVTTEIASAVTSTSATIGGSADPNLTDATGYLRYGTTDPGSCNDTFGTRAPATGGTALGAGSDPVSYTQSLTGLSPGTTYYFCAIATNAVGTGFGGVLSFTTQATAAVNTLAATAVSGTGATLNGSANPNLSATTGYFRYGTTDPGTCSDAFGTRAPTSGGTSLGAGMSPVAYSQVLTGLTAGTTYYYCAAATSGVGTGFGGVMSFTTPGAPTVVTGLAMGMTTSAVLNGTATPNLGASTGYFRYATTDPGTCSDTFGVRAPATGGTALGAGTAPVPFTESLTGLLPGTTYYFCAIAENIIGRSFGAVASFTTSARPTVTTEAATDVTGTELTLNASASPNGAETLGWFRYDSSDPGACDDTFGRRAPEADGTPLGAGSAAVSFTEMVAMLSPATTYYFCAIAQNDAGISFGELLTVTTGAAPPTVTTNAPTEVTVDGATLNGGAIANGSESTGWFRYASTDPGACDDTFGTRAPATSGTALGAGVTSVSFTETLTGLTTGVLYYYCAIAENAEGIAFGAVETFLPGTDPPTVTTGVASDVTGTTATLAGLANPNGTEATGWFRYGTTMPTTCDDAFGLRAPMTGGTALGAGAADVPFTEALTALDPAQTYYYCAAASNLGGARFGEVLTFTTTAAPPTVRTITPRIDPMTGVTFNGVANANGAETVAWFRYDSMRPERCDDTFGFRVPDAGTLPVGAGRLDVTFADMAPELAPGSYFVCALASNEAGTGFGEVLNFVIPPDSVPAGGCGCRVGTRETSPLTLAWLAALGVAVLVRRRRAR